MLTVGVIGCGYWGPNLIRNFHSLSDVKIKSICDLDKKRLNYLKNLYPYINTTQNYEDLIKDNEIDAIVVAAAVFLHYEIGKKSIFILMVLLHSSFCRGAHPATSRQTQWENTKLRKIWQ